MSSGKASSDDIASTLGFVLAGLIFFTKITLALLSFFALIITIFSLLAWRRPLRMGTVTLFPHEARAFVLRGLAGTLLVPAFVVFASAFFGVTFNWHAYWQYLILGGYLAESVGIEVLTADEENPQPAILMPHPSTTPSLPPPDAPDVSIFRFADWDDEEKRG